MKSFHRRSRRSRQTRQPQQKDSSIFESHSSPLRDDSFFQAKLTVGQPGDQYEQEADAVAQQVMSGNDSKKNIMPVGKSIQSMPKEEKEKVQASAEEKKEEEKVQASPEEKKEEEKEKVQRQVIANEPEEEPVQKTGEDLEKEKEEEDKTAVMPKTETPDKVPGSTFEQQLKKNKNRGFALPKEVLREMNTGIGADFGNVHIHNDEAAAGLNQQIGAKAFTHGNDIYFNRGKYDTDTTAGKQLLAHELTHVVQQQAAPVVATHPTHSSTASVVQRQSSTPLPAGVVPDKKSKIAKFKDSGFLIKILPDTTAKKGATDVKENGAVTKGDIKVAVSYQTEGDNVVSVSVTRELIIQTIYGYKAKGTDTSAYGRGTTEEDKKAGSTTLKFHEGSHGQDYLAYIANNPFPVLSIKEPISKQDYETKYAAWQEEVKKYQDNMKADSEKKTDHVGEPME